jgi:hypothetical protein
MQDEVNGLFIAFIPRKVYAWLIYFAAALRRLRLPEAARWVEVW